MSKTNRKFKGKEYRQGHEPCELDLARRRQEKHAMRMQRILDKDALDALEAAAGEEQKAMGY